MNSNISLLFPILFPMLCGIAVGLIPALKDEKRRRVFVLTALSISFLLTISQILLPEASLYVCTLAPKAEISFAVDAVTRFFAGLIAFMWLMSGIFSFEYMKQPVLLLLSSGGRRHARGGIRCQLRDHVSLF